jgi:hypothetical protein
MLSKGLSNYLISDLLGTAFPLGIWAETPAASAGNKPADVTKSARRLQAVESIAETTGDVIRDIFRRHDYDRRR